MDVLLDEDARDEVANLGAEHGDGRAGGGAVPAHQQRVAQAAGQVEVEWHRTRGQIDHAWDQPTGGIEQIGHAGLPLSIGRRLAQSIVGWAAGSGAPSPR